MRLRLSFIMFCVLIVVIVIILLNKMDLESFSINGENACKDGVCCPRNGVINCENLSPNIKMSKIACEAIVNTCKLRKFDSGIEDIENTDQEGTQRKPKSTQVVDEEST